MVDLHPFTNAQLAWLEALVALSYSEGVGSGDIETDIEMEQALLVEMALRGQSEPWWARIARRAQ